MSSECEYEIEQADGSDDHHPGMIADHGQNDDNNNDFMVAQEMIIANDIEAEAEDDDDEMQLNQNDNQSSMLYNNDDSQQQNSSNNEESSGGDDDDDGSDSGPESGSSNDDDDDDDDEEDGDEESSSGDKDDQQSSQQNDDDEDDDEDEEVDISQESNENNQQQQSKSSSTSNVIEQQQQKRSNQQDSNDEHSNDQHSNQQQQDSVADQQQDDNHRSEQQESSGQEESSEKPSTKIRQGYEDETEIIKNCDEMGVYGWNEFKNSKIKPFSREEYERFQQPFRYGWKRELVLRCPGGNNNNNNNNNRVTDKKAGDVYYHTPNGSTKLRSYVEMNLYLKRNPKIIDLNVTNFTYAKQPIYRPPNEIVRHAMQRGANYVERPFAFNQHIRVRQPQSQSQQRKSVSNSNQSQMTTTANNNNSSILSNNEDESMDDGNFGRGKRKRVIPSRYDDEEIDLPMNKRNKHGNHQQTSNRESYSNSNSNDGHSPQSNKLSMSLSSTGGGDRGGGSSTTSKMSAQERRRLLQQQLYHQVNEEFKREKELEQQKQQQQQQRTTTATISTDKESSGRHGGGSSLLKMKIIKGSNGNRKIDQNSGGGVGEQSLLTKDSIASQQQQNGHATNNDGEDNKKKQTSKPESEPMEGEVIQPENCRQPCSTNCPGRRNVLPNLMCYRCFCLFHLDCVPDGMFLKNNLFACPNCVTDDDRLIDNDGDEKLTKNDDQTNEIASTTTITPTLTSTTSTSLLMANSNKMKKMNPNSLLLKQQLTNPSTKLSASSVRPTNNHHSSLINDASSVNSVTTNSKKLSTKFQRKSNNNNESLLSINGHHHNHSNSMKNMNNGQSSMTATNSNSKNKKSLSRLIVPPYVSTPPSLSPHPHSTISTESLSLKFQPGINHIYRLAQSANGHSVVIKDRTQPLLPNGHYHHHSTSHMNGHHNHGQSGIKSDRLTTMNYNYLNSAQKLLHENQALLDETAQQMARTHYYSTLNNGGSLSDLYPGKTTITATTSEKIINPKSKWLKYQQKHFNFFNRFDSMLRILANLVEYLDFKDILNLRLVNRHWSHLLSKSIIWKNLYLNGTPILDWKKFADTIHGSKCWLRSIDFTGIRIVLNQQNQSINLTRNEKINQFWNGFEQILSEISEIESLCFGSVPLFIIENLMNSFEKQSFSRIHTLIVSNIFDTTDSNQQFCTLKFLSKISSIKNSLKTLKLNSNNGLILSTNDQQAIFSSLKQLTRLQTFECLSLKNFTIDQFAQLFSNLNRIDLKQLSIGSCSTWFQPNENETKVDTLFENLSKFSNLITLRLRDVNINSIHSSHLVNLFEYLIIVENLSLENLVIEKSAKQNWTSLLSMLKSLPLRYFHLSSYESFSNRTIFESLIQLLSSQKRKYLHIHWSITVDIDDMGHCWVPLSLKSFNNKHFESNNDDDGKIFIEQYFGSEIQPNDDSYQLIQSSNESSPDNKWIILIEMETLKNLIINKLPSFLRKDPTILSSLDIVPQ